MKRFPSVGLSLSPPGPARLGPDARNPEGRRSPPPTAPTAKSDHRLSAKAPAQGRRFRGGSRPVEVQPTGDQRSREDAKVLRRRGPPTSRLATASRIASTESGGFGDLPGGKTDVTTAAIGAMAAVEVGLPADLFEAAVSKYLGDNVATLEDIRIAAAAFEALGRRRTRPTPGWSRSTNSAMTTGPTARATGPRRPGGAVAAVLRLGGKVEHADAVLKAMKDGQRAMAASARPTRPPPTSKPVTASPALCTCSRPSRRTSAGCGRSSIPAATTTAATASPRASRPASRGHTTPPLSSTGSTRSERMAATAYIGLGGNLGDRRAYLDRAGRTARPAWRRGGAPFPRSMKRPRSAARRVRGRTSTPSASCARSRRRKRSSMSCGKKSKTRWAVFVWSATARAPSTSTSFSMTI